MTQAYPYAGMAQRNTRSQLTPRPLQIGGIPDPIQGLVPQPTGSVTEGYGTSSYAPSNMGRNLAFAGAGLQTLGALGETLYGGRQQRRQAEENRRAIGTANLISILSGGSVAPNPDVMQSSGANTARLLSNVGSGLTSLGQQLQDFRESEIKLKLAEETALIQAKAARRADDLHKEQMRAFKVEDAREKGELAALKGLQAIKIGVDMSDPEIRAEWEADKEFETPHYKSVRQAVTADLMTPLILQGIAKVESGGYVDPYKAEGAILTSGQYKGDRAYGKYQVMGANINPWLREVGLLTGDQEITPEMFMNDPGLQEALVRNKFAEYVRHGIENDKSPEDIIKSAASVWFSGGYDNYKDSEEAERSDGNNTVANYVDMVYDAVDDNLRTIGPSQEYNEDWAELELEKKRFLEMTSSENVKEMMRENNVSLAFQDYFENGMRSKIATTVKEYENDQFQILKAFQTQRLNEEELAERVKARLEAETLARQQEARLAAEDYAAMEKATSDRTLDLFNQYIKLPEVKSYNNYTMQYSKLMATINDFRAYMDAHNLKSLTHEQIKDAFPDQGTYHISIVNNYQRLIDEATVREGDITVWQGKSAGKAEQFMLAVQNIFGGTMFTTETIESMAQLAEAMDKGLRSKLARGAIGYASAAAKSAYPDSADPKRMKQIIARREIFARTVASSALDYISQGAPITIADIQEIPEWATDLVGGSWDRTEKETTEIEEKFQELIPHYDAVQFEASVDSLREELGFPQEPLQGFDLLKRPPEELLELAPLLDVDGISTNTQEERQIKTLLQKAKSGQALTPVEQAQVQELHQQINFGSETIDLEYEKVKAKQRRGEKLTAADREILNRYHVGETFSTIGSGLSDFFKMALPKGRAGGQ
tara:strand:- start:2991 stop:5642 length:2652 start_codon:yes stop_codon:yes gene_type:complete